MKKLMIVAAMLALTACGSIKMASPDQDASVKEFMPIAGKAQIYVCRDGRLMGAALRSKLELNDRFLTNMAINTFIYQEVESGAHALNSKMPAHDSIVDFKTVAGEQRFFQVWPSYGGVMLIDEISPEAGKRCIKAGSLLDREG